MEKDCVAERWCKEGHSTGVSFAFIYSSSSRLCLVDFGLALRAVSGRYDSES